MVNEILKAISARTDIDRGFDLYVFTTIYLDKKGDLTVEDVNHFLPIFQGYCCAIYPHDIGKNFAKTMEFANVLKKYNEVVYDNFMNVIVQVIISNKMFTEFRQIKNLLKFDMPVNAPRYLFDTWSSRLISEYHKYACPNPERYVNMNLAQYILTECILKKYGIYEVVKAHYKKDDVIFAMIQMGVTQMGQEFADKDFLKLFIADLGITNDEKICYSEKTGLKITVYEKIVEIGGPEYANTYFSHLASRPAYPIIKMIPDVGRVTLLDETHATVQNLTATGLIEKQMIYEIIGDTIKLSPEHSVTAKW